MAEEMVKPSILLNNSKRAMSETEEEVKGKLAMLSFKSTLRNMANPKCWKGFSASKGKLMLEQGYLTLSDDPEGSEMKVVGTLRVIGLVGIMLLVGILKSITGLAMCLGLGNLVSGLLTEEVLVLILGNSGVKTSVETSGQVIPKTGNANTVGRRDNMVKNKVGSKGAGYSGTNVKNPRGFRFDILKDMEDDVRDVPRPKKGRGGAVKTKDELSEVTNLKTTPNSSKKPNNYKVTTTVGEGGHKKIGESPNKGENKAMCNTSSGNEPIDLWLGNQTAPVEDKSQAIKEEVGVLQQLHLDIVNATKTNLPSDSDVMDYYNDLDQPSEDGSRNKINISGAYQSSFDCGLQTS
ncbi:hypothetical protein ACOSQ2_018575 [Xanthoceras sorbifolium]